MKGDHMTEARISELLDKRKKYLYPTKIPYYKDPIYLVRAKGTSVWDSMGREYLDLIGGIVSISVGHNHPKIVSKMKELLDSDAIQHTTFIYLSGYMEDLGKKLAELAPIDSPKCYFTNSGSEANEMAVLTAKQATNEATVVALRHCYHGGTSMPMGLCGHASWKYRGLSQSSVVHSAEPYCYRCPFGAERNNCALECAEDIKNVIETVTIGKIAAFIAEPILGVGGFIDPPKEYFKRAYEIIKKFGGLYISDEVQTGIGRTGEGFFAVDSMGFRPDFITCAKGFGNGAPIGVVIGRGDLADSLAGKVHFNTFGGDPYQSMQAGLVLDIIREQGLIENAKKVGGRIIEGLKSLQKDFPIMGDVRGRGLIIGVEFVKDAKSKVPAPEETLRFLNLTKEEGLLVGKGGLRGNVIRIAPPLTLSMTEAETVLKKFENALRKL